MTMPLFLICGVSGSGKTWVCNQLRDVFTYIPHDDHIESDDLIEALQNSKKDKPFITECPFGERLLKEKLENAGFTVKPYFIVEPVEIVSDRYKKREGKDLPKSAVTRATTILNRAVEWEAPRGTSTEILSILKQTVAIKNTKGNVYYGMHFYPGCAEYAEPDKEPYRVLLIENTLRSMDQSFAGRPIFVHHVEEVEPDLNELRKEADGWVIESFYNAADGKHWVKFIVVSEKAEKAIKNGMRLSNCYLPTSFGPGGTWNGIEYSREVTGGEYDHLAIVPNPRYEESIILTPDQFKAYNEQNLIEVKKIANNSGEKKSMSLLNFFKKQKVDNSADLSAMSVMLPKSKIEIEIMKLVNDADEKEMKKDEPVVAQGHHLVDCMGKTMTVNDLVEAHKKACEEMNAMKNDEEADQDEGEDSEAMANEDTSEDEEAKKKALELAEHEAKEIAEEKKKNALEKANLLRNAHLNAKFEKETPAVSTTISQVLKGKELLGSGRF